MATLAEVIQSVAQRAACSDKVYRCMQAGLFLASRLVSCCQVILIANCAVEFGSLPAQFIAVQEMPAGMRRCRALFSEWIGI